MRHYLALGALLIAGGLLALTLGLNAVAPLPKGFVLGYEVGNFTPPTIYTRSKLIVDVKLDSGGTVSVELPPGVADRPGVRIKLSVSEQRLGPLVRESFKFETYVDATDAGRDSE